MKKEQYLEKAKSVHGEIYDYSLIPEEFKVMDRIPIICKKHGIFQQIARNHTNQHQGCPICGKIKLSNNLKDSFNDFLIKSKEIHKGKYEPIEESFIATSKKLKFKCNICGGIYEQRGSMHLAGCGCSICNPPHKKRTTEDFKKQIAKTHPNLEILTPYTTTNGIIKVRCKIHDHTYETTPHRLIQGANCQKCYDERRGQTILKPLEKVLEDIKKVHKDRYSFPNIENEYVNSKTKITAICKKGHRFSMSINKLLIGQGCPICNESHLERDIADIFPEASRYYRAKWLGKQNFDFFLKEMNIAIECQGEQHFKIIKCFGGKDGFINNIKRDIQKYNLSKANKIKLIYVTNKRYKKFLSNKQFKGIYDKNVYFIEDIIKSPETFKESILN